jgi:hypothetical protein
MSPLSHRISYGYSNLGFLYAGKIKDIYRIAYGYSNSGFLYAGKIKEFYRPVKFQNFGIHIICHFLPYINTFIDIMPNTGLFSYIAANICPENSVIHIFESRPNLYKILNKTIYFNNWEDKINLHKIYINNQKPEISVKVDTLDNQIRELEINRVDLIKFESENFEENILEGSKQLIERDHPIIFVDSDIYNEKKEYKNLNHILALEWLKSHGYAVWTSSKRNRLIKVNRLKMQNHPMILLALYNEIPHKWISGFNNWAKQYKSPEIEHESNKMIERILRNMLHPIFIVKKVLKKVLNKFK